ncbi:MAG TPA: DEAD/DEAH box helicase [Candidatus Acidoferrales bacterium]|nr:DEAD/DEAH box helicase [Candidatus Acidoferrales bacterium]
MSQFPDVALPRSASDERPVSFDSFELPPTVRQGIEAAGFTQCTPIQARVLPLALQGKDVAGQAQTGTGKTAAFLITIFSRLLRHSTKSSPEPAPRALIIAPTRELVMQILRDAEALGQFTGLQLHAVYGGIDYRKQRDILRQGCDVLVGTPGRLIDYFKQHVYSLQRVEVLVIDEADRMFDMGFLADLRFLLRRLPPYHKRQSMLFSATLSYAVMELGYEHMNDPVKLEVNPEQITAENVEHTLYHVGKHEKLPLLLGIMKREQPSRTVIFVNTKRGGEWLATRLSDNGYHARAITGDLDQKVRLRLVRDFSSGELPILVATDVASRGLHIDDVSHVINYDLPQDAENYVHRVGRTARAGASGKAISLACEDFVESLEEIEGLTGFKIPVAEASDDMFVEAKHSQHRERSHHSGHPPRKDGQQRRGGPGGGGRGRGRRPPRAS